MTLTPIAPVSSRHLPTRDARGRFVAGAQSAAVGATTLARRPMARAARRQRVAAAGEQQPAMPCRVRRLPPRDSRGRFVAFPTTQAPSWFVLCIGGDRIVAAPSGARPDLAPAPAPTPRSTQRARPSWLTRGELHSAFLVLLLIVVSAWYRLQIPIPQR